MTEMVGATGIHEREASLLVGKIQECFMQEVELILSLDTHILGLPSGSAVMK